jgi:hypothetical protein
MKVKSLDISACTRSTNSKSKKTWWEWSEPKYRKWTTYCEYMHNSGLFVALKACLGWNDNIYNDLQLVQVGFIHIHGAQSGQDWRSQLWMIFDHRPGKPQLRKWHLSQEYPSCVPASYSLGCRSEVCQIINDMAANAAALPRISESMSHIWTQVLNIAQSVLIAKWDWRICSAGSVTKIFPGFSSDL